MLEKFSECISADFHASDSLTLLYHPQNAHGNHSMPSASVFLMHSCIILRKPIECLNALFFASIPYEFMRGLVFDVKKRYQD